MARPVNLINERQDEAIGHAVAQLMWWGYSGAEVWPAVADAVRQNMGRTISAKRVEQVYERWIELWGRIEKYHRPGGYAVTARRALCPDGTLVEHATQLLVEYVPGQRERRIKHRDALRDIRQISREIGEWDERSRPPPPPERPARPECMTPGQHFMYDRRVEAYDKQVKAYDWGAWDAVPGGLPESYRCEAARLDAAHATLAESLPLYRLPGFGLRLPRTKKYGRVGPSLSPGPAPHPVQPGIRVTVRNVPQREREDILAARRALAQR